MKWFLFLSIFALVGAKKFQPQTVEDAAYWKQMGQDLLRQELNKRPINTAAKNVIFFLGDGMSIATVTAARIYKGQLAGQSGEEGYLSFEKFPYGALSKTYCVDLQVADSACSATAYLCGVKTNVGTVGLDHNVVFKDCATQISENEVDSIMDWAQEAKKGTGVVTTTRITNATPAGSYAHVASRYWEDDSFVHHDKANASKCDDVAEQLIERSPGNNFKVMLGGGRAGFLPKNIREPGKGNRLDGKNLIQTWKDANPNGVYVTTDKQLSEVDFDCTDKLFGLFSDTDDLPYHLESEGTETPTLTEMTQAAIKMLQKEPNGYVLLVEGGKIDLGHHDGRAKLALDETVQFDLAIEAAVSMTNRSDTLIIVSADHSHSMTLSGYPVRGNDILGIAMNSYADKKPSTTLSYSDGPGYATAFDGSGERPDLTNVDTTDKDFLQPATVPNKYESHAGEEVPIYAMGPQAHLFQGVYEQNYIAHVIGYAACIGPGMKFCDETTKN